VRLRTCTKTSLNFKSYSEQTDHHINNTSLAIKIIINPNIRNVHEFYFGYLTILSVSRLDSAGWLIMNWEEFERKGTIQAFGWRDWIVTRKVSVRIVSVPGKIRTEHLRNMCEDAKATPSRNHIILILLCNTLRLGLYMDPYVSRNSMVKDFLIVSPEDGSMSRKM
jgi:hypothetical protein